MGPGGLDSFYDLEAKEKSPKNSKAITNSTPPKKSNKKKQEVGDFEESNEGETSSQSKIHEQVRILIFSIFFLMPKGFRPRFRTTPSKLCNTTYGQAGFLNSQGTVIYSYKLWMKK